MTGEALYLLAVVAAFGAFGLTLAWAQLRTGRR